MADDTKIVQDFRYTDNVIMKKEALQELLTKIKEYPIIDIEQYTGEEVENSKQDAVKIGAKYIKVIYGDEQKIGKMASQADLQAIADAMRQLKYFAEKQTLYGTNAAKIKEYDRLLENLKEEAQLIADELFKMYGNIELTKDSSGTVIKVTPLTQLAKDQLGKGPNAYGWGTKMKAFYEAWRDSRALTGDVTLDFFNSDDIRTSSGNMFDTYGISVQDASRNPQNIVPVLSKDNTGNTYTIQVINDTLASSTFSARQELKNLSGQYNDKYKAVFDENNGYWATQKTSAEQYAKTIENLKKATISALQQINDEQGLDTSDAPESTYEDIIKKYDTNADATVAKYEKDIADAKNKTSESASAQFTGYNLIPVGSTIKFPDRSDTYDVGTISVSVDDEVSFVKVKGLSGDGGTAKLGSVEVDSLTSSGPISGTSGTFTGNVTANGDMTANNFITGSGNLNDVISRLGTAENNISNHGTRITNIENSYLTKTDASNTYLTKTDASNTYLTQTDAVNTYLTISNASSTYLTKTDASNSYQAKGNYLGGTYPGNTTQVLRSDGKWANEITGTFKASKVYGAVFNDYAEYRKTNNEAMPGFCVKDCDDGTIEITEYRLTPGASIVSDTFGFSIGETNDTKTPLAVSGRVLAYPYQDRECYHAGMAVCSGPGGTVDIMTRDEIRNYPDCIIGIVSEIPTYDTWGTDNIKVDGRIWIKLR